MFNVYTCVYCKTKGQSSAIDFVHKSIVTDYYQPESNTYFLDESRRGRLTFIQRAVICSLDESQVLWAVDTATDFLLSTLYSGIRLDTINPYFDPKSVAF